MKPCLESDEVTLETTALIADVRQYLTLTPRQLPSRALYDALGSVLFDAICLLPWYPVTRAERRLIERHRTEVLQAAGPPAQLVELGCGNGEKLDLLFGGESPHITLEGLDRVDLVDVSPSALALASRLIGENRALDVVIHQQRYEVGLREAAAARRGDERLCVLFLGSNIGNFDPSGAHAFLTSLRGCLRGGDTLLIGVDLVKPEADLLRAYDDPLGITAAFNKNLLVRLNRELHADFELDGFDHRAVWNAAESRVEMHLVSRRRQRVAITGAALTIDFQPGEMIWTESSYKYAPETFDALLRRTEFATATHWTDTEGQFALFMASA